jgi:hypothetical protein
MKYPLLSITNVVSWLKLIEKYKVSRKARSENGFLTNYLNEGKALLHQKSDQPNLYTWEIKRDLFLDRTVPAFNKNPTIRRYLSLIAWAYEPKVTDQEFSTLIIELKQK